MNNTWSDLTRPFIGHASATSSSTKAGNGRDTAPPPWSKHAMHVRVNNERSAL